MISPLAHLVPTAPSAHGGSKGRPADDEREHQMKQEEKTMGSIILTGLRFGEHSFSLNYPVVDGQMICVAHCECGYEVEIPNFNSYAGGRYIQWVWDRHTKNLK